MERNHICKKCGGIAGWDSYFQSWICTRCGNEEPKPITNTDKFRSMNDEELADFYSNKLDVCPPEHDNSKCIDELYAHGEGPYPSNKQCMKCWINWLKQEANP